MHRYATWLRGAFASSRIPSFRLIGGRGASIILRAQMPAGRRTYNGFATGFQAVAKGAATLVLFYDGIVGWAGRLGGAWPR
jgi:hypothetical protein